MVEADWTKLDCVQVGSLGQCILGPWWAVLPGPVTNGMVYLFFRAENDLYYLSYYSQPSYQATLHTLRPQVGSGCQIPKMLH